MLMFLIFLGLFVCCTNSAPQIYENQDASLDRSKWNENRFNRAIEIERNMRIVGGSVASATQFQHSVALFLKLHQGDSFCGGSIIHPNYVLTAAHCLDDLIQIEMLAGTTTIFNGRPGYREIIPASDTRQHHNYDRNTLRNDIGIICARTRIPFNDRIRAIRLPSANLNLNTVRNSANRPSLIGWGRTSDGEFNFFFFYHVVCNLINFLNSKSKSFQYTSIRSTSHSSRTKLCQCL